MFPTLFWAQATSKNAFGGYVQTEIDGIYIRINVSVGQDSITNKFGFALGADYYRKLNDNLTFRTGIGYGFKQCIYNETNLVFGTDLLNNTTSRLESSVQFHEINLPLVFQIKIFKGFHFTSGIEISKAFSDKSIRVVYYGTEGTERLSATNINGLNVSPHLSLLYQIRFANASFINLEPFYTFYLRPYLFKDIGCYKFGLRVSYGLFTKQK